jgi:ribosomal protein S14
MGRLKTAKRKYGKSAHRCTRCGNQHGVVRKYGLNFCRKCMREIANSIGFKKYS